MRAQAKFFVFSTLFFAFTSITASAQNVYIKDEVFVPLRSGPSSQHRILHKGLKSSTVLEVISSSEDGSWLNIKTTGGLEGWLPSQYISREPTAEIKLESAEKRLANIEKELKSVKEEYAQSKNELNKTTSDLRKTSSAQQQANMELQRIKSISSGAIELDQKYQNLLEQHQLLATNNDALNAENEGLKSDRRFSYMFYGALLVIIGMLMSVILPHLKVKKRHSEWAN